MYSPLVSIIIPCYNAEDYVAEAIQSALDQSYKNCEVIVIDDGSTDNSLSCIKSFGDVIRWQTGPNRGGSAARNLGLKVSNGKFIQFLDADDILYPRCVADKIANLNPSKGTVCCLWTEDSGTHTPLANCFDRFSEVDLERMIRFNAPPTPAPLHNSDSLRKVGGFKEGLSCAQEFDLHLRICNHLEVPFFSNGQVGFHIRANEKSVSRSAGMRMPVNEANTLMLLSETIQEEGMGCSVKDALVFRLGRTLRYLARGRALKEAQSIATFLEAYYPGWMRICYRNVIAAKMARVLGWKNYERVHAALIGLCGSRRPRA